MKETEKAALEAESMPENAGQPEEIPAAQDSGRKEPPGTEAPAGPCVYAGPPIKGTILNSTFTVFSDGIPAEYREHPALRHLFVPPGRLDRARAEIGKKGTLLNTCYMRAAKEFSGKGGK